MATHINLKMVVKLNCICAFCLLLCCTSAQTQNFGLSFHHKDQEDGLGLSDNYFFFQDRQGFLWISTQEGLNRFDGKQFVKFTHSTDDACSIAENRLTSPCFEDQYGDLWLTSSSKVLCYQRKTGCFAAWSLPNAPLLPYSAFFLAKNGLLWLSIGNESQKQLYHFDTHAKTFLPQPTLIEGDRATLIFDTNGQPTHIAETQLPTRAGMVLRSLNDGTSIYHDFLLLKSGKKRVFPSPTNAAWADGDKSRIGRTSPPLASVIKGMSSNSRIRRLKRSTAGISAGAGRYRRWPCVLAGQAIRNRAMNPVPRGRAPARAINPRQASGWTMTPKVNRRSRSWNDDLLRRSTAISPPSQNTLSNARLRIMVS